MNQNTLAICKDCLDDYDTAEMVWLKGWTCETCYRLITTRLCGDCLQPVGSGCNCASK